MFVKSKTTKISLMLLFIMLFAFVMPSINQNQNTVYAWGGGRSGGGGGSSGGGGAGGSWGNEDDGRGVAPRFYIDVERIWDKEISSPHIFSRAHIVDGIMNLGRSRRDIFEKIIEVAKLASWYIDDFEGTKTIETYINGYSVTVRMHLVDGEVVSLNAFRGTSSRILGELVNFTNKDF